MSTLGEAITMARRAGSLTQEELADTAGVTQAALSRYENNLREPNPETLNAIAAALGVTSTFLQRAAKLRGAMAVDAHMRRRKTAKPSEWKQLEARLNMIRSHAEQLLDDIDLRADQSVPSFDPLDTDPADAARLVRMQWRMPIGPVHNLVGWLEAAGCIVIDEDFGTARVDGLSQWVSSHPVLMSNSQSPTDRKRLTIAHELGHLCLHSVDIGDEPEDEANAFAAEFLMPAEVIKPQLRNLTLGRLHELKRYWGVSMQSIIERAYRLGCMTATERTTMYKRFSSRGWRTREPLSDVLAPERPSLVKEVGRALVAKGLTDQEIAELAGFAEPTDRNPFHVVSPGLRLLP